MENGGIRLNRIRSDKFLAVIVLLTVFVGVSMWLSAKTDRSAPSVREGVLDVGGWDFDENGTLSLDGDWAFYPNVLLTPDQTRSLPMPRRYLHVPGNWDGWQDGESAAMKGYGYGTYRLVIRNAPQDRQLAISKNYARFADKLYVGGVQMAESGQTGTSRENYVPRNVPYTVNFSLQETETEVLLQVANFDYKNGGITNSLHFGLAGDIAVKKNVQSALEWMGLVFFMFLGLLMAGLYVWLQRDSLLLLLGAFFFIFAVTIIMNGERQFLQLFPEVSFELAFKIKSISVYMTPALLFSISRKLIVQPVMRSIFLVSAWSVTVYCAWIVVLPFRIYSIVQDAMYAAVTAVYAVLAVFLLISYMTGRYGSLEKRQFQLFFGAVWSILLTGISVILSHLNLVSAVLTNITVDMLILFIATLLIHQYVGAYSAMRRLTRQLQIADRMKDEFLLITSHELNTPLHGIINMSQSLLKTPYRKSSETAMKEKLQMIRNTAYRMSNMVKDIIDVSRMKEGRLEVRIGRVDLATCVTVVMEVFGFLAKGKNTVLVHRIDSDARFVAADENRLVQVLYNAINHSLKNRQDGVLSIGSSRQGGFVHIVVEHTGASHAADGGDAAADAEAENGFAVGLSVAYELVELMDGKFMLNGDSGMIEIDLPAAEAADKWSYPEVAVAMEPDAAPSSEPADSVGRSSKSGMPRLLIASADPVNVEHLYGMLVTEGFDVVCAVSDAEAYSLITRLDRPDLVLLDVMLPEGNGYELCRRIRRHFTQAELPVLFISVRNTPADIEAGIEAGGSDFIARPLDAGEIRVRVNTLLAMKRLVKEAAMSEMAFLRSQIKPHFLYNALGTIMSLCYTDGVRAGELLGIFSRYLRIIFHMDNTDETVTLSKEMELIQAYVDIEKERFGDRVRVVFDVDEQLYRCQVMPLTIEPLVENAIRHGVSKKVSGGTVRLTIRKQDEFVQVIVEDDGVGMTPEQVQAIMERGKQEQGVGFRNITRRVAFLTGRQPVVESERGKGTKITIWLPLDYL